MQLDPVIRSGMPSWNPVTEDRVQIASEIPKPWIIQTHEVFGTILLVSNATATFCVSTKEKEHHAQSSKSTYSKNIV